ncbi:MAG: DUF1810 domain-containing protein [Flavobacteriales bacterium]|nr:MAG: DUF1810 domain-containing protein [Flavobacteriales bacterium]
MEYDLKRFIDAQEGDYQIALAELARGKKSSHWMWYIFPQLTGLEQSDMAKLYAIKDLDEAKLYYTHPTLGNRLVECCETLLSLNESNALKIFGSPDDLKLKSCLTLFAVASGDVIFESVLAQYFNGEKDGLTLSILKEQANN